MPRPTLVSHERVLPIRPEPRQGMSLLAQGGILVAAAAVAGLLGYWAAEGLKSWKGQTSASKPAAVSASTGEQAARPAPSTKAPCIDCENRTLPTP